jgi:hypothetical protein
MKLARSFGLCFFVIAALVQMPTGASAELVSTITLPEGTWNATVTVTGRDAGNTLAFGMTSPQNFQICGNPPTAGGCVPGDVHTFSGLSGDLVFYLTDQTCGQTFQSTDAFSAKIDQTDSTHWTIGWDDAGNCTDRDGDNNDLTTSVFAWQGTADSASGFYNGTDTLDISTPFGAKGDSMRSEIIVPPSTGLDGYQAGQVIDEEKSNKDPLYINFCGGMCDAQVDKSTLPSGSQANTESDPGAPIQVILYYKDNALSGDAVYAQGDAFGATPQLLAKCFGPTVASVNGVDPSKCVASITTSSGKDKIKKVVVLVPSGNDPIIGKH